MTEKRRSKNRHNRFSCCACVEPKAWSTVLNVFSDMDGFIAISFYLIAVLGTVIAIKALKEDK